MFSDAEPNPNGIKTPYVNALNKRRAAHEMGRLRKLSDFNVKTLEAPRYFPFSASFPQLKYDWPL
jgi:hypothetical protein